MTTGLLSALLMLILVSMGIISVIRGVMKLICWFFGGLFRMIKN